MTDRPRTSDLCQPWADVALQFPDLPSAHPRNNYGSLVPWLGWFVALSVAVGCTPSLPDIAKPTDQPTNQPVDVAGNRSPGASPGADPAPAAKSTVSQDAQAVAQVQAMKANAAQVAQELWQSAMDKAYSAAKLAQVARTAAEWDFVALRWQEAIATLEQIPDGTGQRSPALSKASEYRQNEAIARRQSQFSAKRPNSANLPDQPLAQDGQPVRVSSNEPAPSTNRVEGASMAQVPIIRRIGGIPAIEVLVNGQPFMMMLDTGASATVITEEMADQLGLKAHGSVKVNTPSDRAVDFGITRLNSINVGGAITRDLDAAIAPAMEIGLLGQNFLGHFDVTIRQGQIELKRHQS